MALSKGNGDVFQSVRRAHRGSERARLAWSGAPLAAATAISGLLSYAFTLILTRALGPEVFGSVGALLGAAVIGSVPATALQLESARLVASGAVHGARWLVRAALGVSVVTMGVGLVLVPVLDAMLRLRTPVDAALLAALLFPQTLTGGLLGILLGRGRIALFSAVLIAVGMARLGAAVVTQVLDGGSTFALAAAVVGTTFAMGMAVVAVRCTGRDEDGSRHPGGRTFVAGLVRATAGAGALMVLLNADLLIARTMLDDTTSGLYAFLTIFGRVTFWGTSFLSLWVFPRVASTASATRAIRYSMGVVVGGGVLATVTVALFSEQLVAVLAGAAYVGSAQYAALFALAGALISVVQLATYVDVARGRHRVTTTVWCGAALMFLLSVLVRPASIGGIISLALGILAGVCALAALALVERPSDATQLPPPAARPAP